MNRSIGPHRVKGGWLVVRTPFNPSGLVVELLDAEHRTLRSRAVEGGAFDEVYPVRFEKLVEAGFVCIHDEAGTSGTLSEVSVWWQAGTSAPVIRCHDAKSPCRTGRSGPGACCRSAMLRPC